MHNKNDSDFDFVCRNWSHYKVLKLKSLPFTAYNKLTAALIEINLKLRFEVFNTALTQYCYIT